MKKNVTITMDDHQIASAKLYAKKHGKSLSSIVEEFMKEYIRKSEQEQNT